MMNFRKIAAASKGQLLLRYFTEDRPEPIHRAPVDEAGRQLEEGGRLTAYYTGRDSRATWRPDMPALVANAIGIDPRQMPHDEEMSRLFEGRRADTGDAWSQHKRTLSGFDLRRAVSWLPNWSVAMRCSPTCGDGASSSREPCPAASGRWWRSAAGLCRGRPACC